MLTTRAKAEGWGRGISLAKNSSLQTGETHWRCCDGLYDAIHMYIGGDCGYFSAIYWGHSVVGKPIDQNFKTVTPNRLR